MEYQIKYTEFLARAREILKNEFLEISNMVLSIGLEEDETQIRIEKLNDFLDFVKSIQTPFISWTNKEVEIGIDLWLYKYNSYNTNLLLAPSDDFARINKQVIEGANVVALPEGSGTLKKDSSGNIFWDEEKTVIDLGNL